MIQRLFLQIQNRSAGLVGMFDCVLQTRMRRGRMEQLERRGKCHISSVVKY